MFTVDFTTRFGTGDYCFVTVISEQVSLLIMEYDLSLLSLPFDRCDGGWSNE